MTTTHSAHEPVDGPLKTHVGRRADLIDEIVRLGAELQAHEKLLALTADEHVVSLFDELCSHGSPAGRDADLASYAAECGVALPDGACLRVRSAGHDQRIAEADVAFGDHRWTVAWIPGFGFITTAEREQLPPERACQSVSV